MLTMVGYDDLAREDSWLACPTSRALSAVGSAMIARERRQFGSILVRPSRGRDGGRATLVIRYRDASGTSRTKAIGPDLPRFRRLAEQTLAKVWGLKAEEKALGVKHVAPISLTEFWTILEPILKARQRPSSFRVDKQRYLALAEYFGTKAMKDIRSEDVQDLIVWLKNKTRVVKSTTVSNTSNHEKAEGQTTESKTASKAKTITGVSNGTINRYLSTLSTALEEAIPRAYAIENPVRKVKRAKEALSAVPYLSLLEIQQLAALASPTMKPVILLAAETGLRRGELTALTWQDIDLATETLLVRTSKSGKPRQVPLTPLAIDTLTKLRDTRGATPMTGAHPVFPSYQGASKDNMTRDFKKAASKAGRATLRLHDLRHAFASRLCRAGVPIPTVGELLGHSPSSLAVVFRYARHQPDGAGRAAVARLAADSIGTPPHSQATLA